MTNSIFFKNNNNFLIFGIQHILVVSFFLVLGFILIRSAKNVSEEKQFKIGNIIGFTLSATILVGTALKIYFFGFDIKKDLPFQLCYFIALFFPVFTISRKKVYYDILLFWILAGTFQAIFSPELKNGFPHLHFIKFWIIHCGLIIAIFYATFVYNMRPTLKSSFISFFALQGYFVLTLFINKITGANYFYLNAKPNVPSVLDYLGDWPNYIIVVELFLIPYFLLIYAPFYLTSKKIV